MTTTEKRTETPAAPDAPPPRSGLEQVAPGTRVAPTLIGALAILAGCVVALGIGIVARHHAQAELFNGSARIDARETSFGIGLSRTSVPAGRIGFDVQNTASIPHEFVVFKTKLPADQLPLGKDGDVVEDAPQLRRVVDSGSSLAPGSTRALFATLDEGHYVVVCNLPGHYRNGMRIDLTVRDESSSGS